MTVYQRRKGWVAEDEDGKVQAISDGGASWYFYDSGKLITNCTLSDCLEQQVDFICAKLAVGMTP